VKISRRTIDLKSPLSPGKKSKLIQLSDDNDKTAQKEEPEI
jgi:hypothetical protein